MITSLIIFIISSITSSVGAGYYGYSKYITSADGSADGSSDGSAKGSAKR